MSKPENSRTRPYPRNNLRLLLGTGLLAAAILARPGLGQNSSAVPAVTVAPPAVVDLAGTSIELNAEVTGAEPGSYQIGWALNGVPIPGATSPSLLISDLASLTNAGSYTASITGSSGQTASSPAAVATGPGFTFTTIAGVGGGSSDGTGFAASFELPSSVATDGLGNIYVADTANDTIRKIAPGDIVTTIAGSAGNAGSSDGTGGNARFGSPAGVAVDSSGNIYVSDTGNNTIRKISPSGAVTTLAGTAGEGGASDGDGPSARFNAPLGLAVDGAGNIYVADSENNTVREISPSGTVSTAAGIAGTAGSADGAAAGLSATATFNTPSGVSVDGSGNVYVADTGNDTIRILVPSTGMVTTLAGTAGLAGSSNGPGASASFSSPVGVAVDSSGNVFVGDSGNDTVREISTLGVVSTLAGASIHPGSSDGMGPAAQFNSPLGVAVSPGGVFVADAANNTIRNVSVSGVATTVAGLGSTGYSNGPSNLARFLSPSGVAVDAGGNVYIADPAQCAVRMLSPGGAVTTLAGGSTAGSADGTGPAASFNIPSGVAVDGAGNVYVADTGNSTIREISPGGLTTTLAGIAGAQGNVDGVAAVATFDSPLGVAVDASGTVYVADTGNGTVRRIGTAGTVSTLAGSPGVFGYFDGTGANAQFDELEGIATDPAGNIYVVEGTGTVRMITPAGVVTTVAGTFLGLGDIDGSAEYSQFYLPEGVAVDAQGDVFISNTGHDTIRKISPSGTVTTVAGVATAPGDANGQGTAARFFSPVQIAVDASGALYVADSANHTVRKGVPPIGSPLMTSSPADLTISPGGNATFSATATGAPPPTFQWYFDGVPIVGATSSSYSITGAAPSNGGTYYVTATNSVGVASSTVATLDVSSGAVPAITAPPSSQAVQPGSTVTFSVTASGAPPLSYQWNFNGSPISGATAATYTIPAAAPANAGTYGVVVSDPFGSVTSHPASLVVSAAATGARLVNLSARAVVGTSSDILIAGFFISGTGGKSVLVRGVGPTLGGMGVTGFLAEPAVSLFNASSTLIASNSGWGNSPALSAAFGAAGAFPLLSSSADSALALSLPSNTSYTCEVAGGNGGTGIALAEIYDTDLASSPTRLTNISGRAHVATGGGILIAGFVIGGVGNETVLVRAIGPSLSQFGLSGVLPNPVLTVYDSAGNKITSDAGWQNPVSIPAGAWVGRVSPTDATHAIFSATAAFDLGNGTSDSAIVMTLPAGAYTAQVADLGGNTGVALVEVYEVPQ
jgi:sugar lactone lactonase YvrE